MERHSDIIDQVFRPVYGLPCWNVQPGIGSFLTMEFGQPHLVVHEPHKSRTRSSRSKKPSMRRLVYPHGDWHLWIYCCEWHLYTGKELIGDSALKSTSKRRIIRAAQELGGQKLIQVSVDPRRGRSVFHFDLGSRLETRPYDLDSEQWMFYDAKDYVLTYRADGLYQHQPSNVPREDDDWQQFATGRKI
ncbi:hypothetical protein TFLX_00299 [Thermoflexales bacterium]|nr:hypothetical protein TFLX_00299 [Thermoflexales bacterium]